MPRLAALVLGPIMAALSRNDAAPAALVLSRTMTVLSRNYAAPAALVLKALQCSAEGADRR